MLRKISGRQSVLQVTERQIPHKSQRRRRPRVLQRAFVSCHNELFDRLWSSEEPKEGNDSILPLESRARGVCVCTVSASIERHLIRRVKATAPIT
jgi:hypothetical protein